MRGLVEGSEGSPPPEVTRILPATRHVSKQIPHHHRGIPTTSVHVLHACITCLPATTLYHALARPLPVYMNMHPHHFVPCTSMPTCIMYFPPPVSCTYRPTTMYMPPLRTCVCVCVCGDGLDCTCLPFNDRSFFVFTAGSPSSSRECSSLCTD